MISDGSSLNLRNNCFVNNSFSGIGPIIVHTNEISLPVNSQSINNAGTEDDGTMCEFLGLIPSESFQNGLFDNLSCVDYEGVEDACIIRS